MSVHDDKPKRKPPPGRKKDPELESKIVRMYVALGMSVQQIASQLRLQPAVILLNLTRGLDAAKTTREVLSGTLTDQFMFRSVERALILNSIARSKAEASMTRLRAIDLLRLEDERAAKLLGLDAPQKSEVFLRTQPLNRQELEAVIEAATPEELIRIREGDLDVIAEVFKRAGIKGDK